MSRKETGLFVWQFAGSDLKIIARVISSVKIRNLLLRCLVIWQSGHLGAASCATVLTWKKLPHSPETAGLGGLYAGVSGGALLIAGGTNFPEDPPWKNGRKAWFDTIYALEKPSGAWRAVGKLPRAQGYGVSLTTSKGFLCIGGCDAEQHHRDVFLLELVGGSIRTTNLPQLPGAMAYGSGALLGNSLYVAGGTDGPQATNALRSFWTLDLSAAKPSWKELEPWPGPARMLAVMAAQAGAVYLVSGADIHPDPTGQPIRTYLKDVYSYQPASGWTRKADIPRAAVASASPAPPSGKNQFFVISGDDGSRLGFKPPEQHPGFAKSILAYNTDTDEWTDVGTAPQTQVTLPAVVWHGEYVLPNGEVRPGVRTSAVWSLRFSR